MRPVPPQSNHQLGVFTIEQAITAGWTVSMLKTAARRDRLIRLRRGAYALPDPTDAIDVAAALLGKQFLWSARERKNEQAINQFRLAQRGIAAALCVPGGVVSHSSALAVRGLPIWRTPDEPCLLLPPGVRTRQEDLHMHRLDLRPGQLDLAVDVATTFAARSCIDAAREHGIKAGLVAMDAALHRELTTTDELRSVYSTLRGRGGTRAGKAMIEFADGRSESPIESISRYSMQGQVPAPELQMTLYSTLTGEELGRGDFWWEEFGLVGEADGRDKYTDEENWEERLRQERFASHHLVVARWRSPMANDPRSLGRYLEYKIDECRALRAAGYPPLVRAVSRPVGRWLAA